MLKAAFLFAICVSSVLFGMPSNCAEFKGSQREMQFDFSYYEGEGVFTLFSVKINPRSKLVSLCFLHSNYAQQEFPEKLPGIVYQGKSWSGLYDIMRDKGTKCTRTELAVGGGGFTSLNPIDLGDGRYYQFFCICKLLPDKHRDGAFVLDGSFYVFLEQKEMEAGSRVYLEEVSLHVPAVATLSRPTVQNTNPDS